MASNYSKKSNTTAGIITIAVIFVMALVDFIFFKNRDLLYYVPIVPTLLCGILLLFVRIKSYGWAIALSVLLGSILSNLFAESVEIKLILAYVLLSVVCIVFLVYKNIKKQ